MSSAPSDADLAAVIGTLELETKVRLLSGSGPWTTQAVDEIGLRSLTVSDGPVGVRGGTDTELDVSAALPSGSAMGATWDEDLLRRLGEVRAGEAVRKGVDVVLGPTINLHRSPLNGRHFECFSEDPLPRPTALADAPVRETTPTDGKLAYTEGRAIGHRAYLANGIEPAYWFGHGLGYTTWEYDGLDAPAEAPGDGFSVVVRLRNTGARRGRQVVQVYASRPGSAVERPVRWLAGFAVVHADAGEVVDVPVTISSRALRHWDADRQVWAVEAGELVLAVGRSAGELCASTTVTISPDGPGA